MSCDLQQMLRLGFLASHCLHRRLAARVSRCGVVHSFRFHDLQRSLSCTGAREASFIVNNTKGATFVSKTLNRKTVPGNDFRCSSGSRRSISRLLPKQGSIWAKALSRCSSSRQYLRGMRICGVLAMTWGLLVGFSAVSWLSLGGLLVVPQSSWWSFTARGSRLA